LLPGTNRIGKVGRALVAQQILTQKCFLRAFDRKMDDTGMTIPEIKAVGYILTNQRASCSKGIRICITQAFGFITMKLQPHPLVNEISMVSAFNNHASKLS